MEPLHPKVIHFPIVMLILAGVCYLLHLFLKKYNLDKFAFFLHVGGLLGCVAALLTGDYAESNIVQTPEIHEIIEEHEFLGQMTTYAFAILGVWAFLRQRSNIALEKIVFVLVFWAGLGLMAIGAHHGGELVYDHGAGVKPMEKHLIEQRDAAPTLPEPD